MKESEWEDSFIEGGPEELLDNLLKSGYPWHALGKRLKSIDHQFRDVTNEYAEIKDLIDKLTSEVDIIKRDTGELVRNIPSTVKNALREEASSLQYRWLVGTGSVLTVLIGLVLTIITSQTACIFLKQNGVFVGILLMLMSIVTLFIISKTNK